jgi:uroporphyrinogen decarboxylase
VTRALRESSAGSSAATTGQPLLLRAARRESVERTPIWFMRQAGRALPEYRQVREHHGLFEICQTPELCAEVTMQPVDRLGVDGAVLFADIMLPIAFGLGVDLELVENVGPIIERPLRSEDDIARLRATPAEEAVPFVMDTIRILRRELRPGVTVIGFSGAPFTVASYLIEGRPSRDFLKTKAMMHGQPALWHALMERLSRMVLDYLLAQARAGAQVVQLFDSWVGALAPNDYRERVMPYVAPIFAGLEAHGIPSVHFGTATAGLLTAMREAGGDVIGLDWRVELGAAWREIGFDRGVQGNLDPATMLADWPVIERAAGAILEGAERRPGHIFNLGHGVLPDTPVDHLRRLVELVHAW